MPQTSPSEFLFDQNDVVQVATGWRWTLVLKTDGKVYSIGFNDVIHFL
jgi:alpha-tubulin suppressor-like RCC1 family protein